MNNKKLIITLSTVVFVLIIGIIFLVIFSKKEPNDNDEKKLTPAPIVEPIEIEDDEELEEVTLKITNKTYSANSKKTVSNFKTLIKDLDFSTKESESMDDEFDLYAAIEDGVITVDNGHKLYKIDSIKNPVNIKVSALSAADTYPIELYVLTKENKLYNVLIYEDDHATINQYNISNIQNFASSIELRLDNTEEWRNFIIIKTTNGKYYTDYHFTSSEKYNSTDTIKLVEIK